MKIIRYFSTNAPQVRVRLTLNKTTIVIAHRLSTILKSHKIYVVDKGRIINYGNHKDLLLTSSIYKNFYERQIKEN